MKIPIPHDQEKRQFGRVKISQPQRCHIHVPQSQKLWVNQGIIRNISLGGIYFVCDSQPPLAKGAANYLIFDMLRHDQTIYRLKLHALVVRKEDRQPNTSQFGVALQLLSDPIYYLLKEINLREYSLLDKTRLMYQHYALNRQAHEIIQKTPKVREEIINNIRERIDQGLYKIDPKKLSHCIIANLTGKFHNIADEFYRRILK